MTITMKLFCTGIVILLSAHNLSAQNVESFGIFGGANLPFTSDQGLRKDPRFFPKVILRGNPVGFLYGYDKVGYGFCITPSYSELGQRFNVRDVQGGEVGTRDIRLNYLTVPVALKIHVNDLAFFRLSIVASLAPSFLLSGRESYTIAASELNYPAGVTKPPGYTAAYDGVYVPKLTNATYVAKDKFSLFQVFAGVGFRSDFDFSENWSLNFDGRANFGVLDPRTHSYIHTLQNPSASTPDAFNNPGAPDIYGPRRDFFLSFQFGICRIIQSREKFNARHSGKVIFKKTAKTRKPSAK